MVDLQQRVNAFYDWYEPLLKSLSQCCEPQRSENTITRIFAKSSTCLCLFIQLKSIEGEAHQQIFTVSCQVRVIEKKFGKGTSRRRAEQDAR